MYKKTNQEGFTLIELLIVIVIIGILTGVLISVIDPVRQQNRARNASIEAAITKAGFAINTARAGLGRLPYDVELMSEIENIQIDDTSCADTTTLSCEFDMSGANLPNTCTTHYSGINGTVSCTFYVIAPNPSGSLFRIIGKKYKLNPGSETEEDKIYVYDSSVGFYECAGDYGAEVSGDYSFTNDVSADCTMVGDTDAPTT